MERRTRLAAAFLGTHLGLGERTSAFGDAKMTMARLDYPLPGLSPLPATP